MIGTLGRLFHIAPPIADDKLKDATLLCFVDLYGQTYKITPAQLAIILLSDNAVSAATSNSYAEYIALKLRIGIREYEADTVFVFRQNGSGEERWFVGATNDEAEPWMRVLLSDTQAISHKGRPQKLTELFELHKSHESKSLHTQR